jgi:hypothetical protein
MPNNITLQGNTKFTSSYPMLRRYATQSLLELAEETPDVLDSKLMVEAALDVVSLDVANGSNELRISASAFWLYDLDLLGIAGRAAVGGGCMRAASAPPRTNTAAVHQTTCENTTIVSPT